MLAALIKYVISSIHTGEGLIKLGEDEKIPRRQNFIESSLWNSFEVNFSRINLTLAWFIFPQYNTLIK